MWLFNSKTSVNNFQELFAEQVLIPRKSQNNVVHIHKKGYKQLLQSYWPVSVLSICGKIFERIIFSPIFEYLKKKSDLSKWVWFFIHLTHVKTSYYQSFMTSTIILINIRFLKWEPTS